MFPAELLKQLGCNKEANTSLGHPCPLFWGPFFSVRCDHLRQLDRIIAEPTRAELAEIGQIFA
jgi:hypothetical protein